MTSKDTTRRTGSTAILILAACLILTACVLFTTATVWGTDSALSSEPTASDARSDAPSDPPADNQSDDPAGGQTIQQKEKKTTLSGVDESISKDYDKSASDTVTVNPAYGRPVELYLKNEDTGEWILKKTFVTDNTKRAEVAIRYPNNWKAHATSHWKILVPKANLSNSLNITPAEKAEARTTLHNKFLHCKTAVAISADSGELIYDLKKDKKRKVASLTKMMTALLLVDRMGMSSKIRIRQSSINEVRPWQHGFRAGDRLTARNALYAMMIASANEVAAATGVRISGSRKSFVRRMNRRARELGMTTTRYKNAHGLDVGRKQSTGNYSTAMDQALLARIIMTTPRYKAIRKAMRKKHKTVRTTGGRSYYLETTNEILGKNGCIGMKTGTDNRSGYCFAGAFRYKGKVYITVVLGTKSEASRWKNTKRLYRYVKYAVKHNISAY